MNGGEEKPPRNSLRGGGGGRPTLATAGAKHARNLDEVLATVRERISGLAG